jgi:hypothetical protein
LLLLPEGIPKQAAHPSLPECRRIFPPIWSGLHRRDVRTQFLWAFLSRMRKFAVFAKARMCLRRGVRRGLRELSASAGTDFWFRVMSSSAALNSKSKRLQRIRNRNAVDAVLPVPSSTPRSLSVAEFSAVRPRLAHSHLGCSSCSHFTRRPDPGRSSP